MTSCASSRRSRLCQRAGLGREMFARVRNMPRPRERRPPPSFRCGVFLVLRYGSHLVLLDTGAMRWHISVLRIPVQPEGPR